MTSEIRDMTEARIGIVLIGRNEGKRLVACLQSLPADVTRVYVDSGSTDGSLAAATARGVIVAELDATRFSAAHARNIGAKRLLEADPDVELIQFLDGDCELRSGWLETAAAYLADHADFAVACGRRRERCRDASVFNRLCDLEWDTPVGEADSCGGDALFRSRAFFAAGGYRDDMIAGEEPELCVRLRQHGWRIARLDAEMTLHDAAMFRASQWWRRAVRAGHAFAEGHAIHPSLWHRESRSIAIWGLLLPMLILLAGLLVHPAFFAALGVYPLLALKVFRHARKRWPAGESARYAIACVLAKFPQAQGLIRYHANRCINRPSRIIEYKGVTESAPAGEAAS
jgi:GT2 family glycosyltransferase